MTRDLARELFEVLVREHADSLMAFLRAAGADPHLAEDVFQESCLTAWRRLEDYDRTRPFGPWLRGIAARVLLSQRRLAGRESTAFDEELLERLDARCEQLRALPGDTWDERLDALRACLETLPESYRSPIQLRFAEDLPPAAIADRLRLGLETVKKRLLRAKSRLLECLDRKLSRAAESTRPATEGGAAP